jgi:hypothetical protein
MMKGLGENGDDEMARREWGRLAGTNKYLCVQKKDLCV